MRVAHTIPRWYTQQCIYRDNSVSLRIIYTNTILNAYGIVISSSQHVHLHFIQLCIMTIFFLSLFFSFHFSPIAVLYEQWWTKYKLYEKRITVTHVIYNMCAIYSIMGWIYVICNSAWTYFFFRILWYEPFICNKKKESIYGLWLVLDRKPGAELE